MYVSYFYDSTGYIGNVAATSAQPSARSGLLVINGYIPATLTTTNHDESTAVAAVNVGAGWSFTLSNGVPAVDANGNYLVTPPAYEPMAMNPALYAVVGHFNSGALKPAQVLPDDLNVYNWALNAAGLTPLAGTSIVAMPVKTAVTTLMPVPPTPAPAPAPSPSAIGPSL